MNMVQNVPMKFPVHKACWVKPDEKKIMNSKNLNVFLLQGQIWILFSS
jgi:hypothetical protein